MSRAVVRSVVGALLVTTTACSASRGPFVLARNFAQLQLRTVAFPPIVDVRPDRFEHVRVTVRGREAASRVLAAKGYEVTPVALPEALRSMRAVKMADIEPAALAAMFDPSVGYVLVLFLENLDYGGESPGETSITMSGVLVDVAGKRLLWQDRSIGHSSLGGLFTILSGPSTEYEAVYEAVRGVLRTLPDAVVPAVDRGRGPTRGR